MNIGVARILSGGALLFHGKVNDFFSPRPQNTRKLLINLSLAVQISSISSKNWTLALPREGVHSPPGGSALTTFPCKFGPEKNFLRPGGGAARAPSAPPGYAYYHLCYIYR